MDGFTACLQDFERDLELRAEAIGRLAGTTAVDRGGPGGARTVKSVYPS